MKIGGVDLIVGYGFYARRCRVEAQWLHTRRTASLRSGESP